MLCYDDMNFEVLSCHAVMLCYVMLLCCYAVMLLCCYVLLCYANLLCYVVVLYYTMLCHVMLLCYVVMLYVGAQLLPKVCCRASVQYATYVVWNWFQTFAQFSYITRASRSLAKTGSS